VAPYAILYLSTKTCRQGFISVETAANKKAMAAAIAFFD
jgi:hypothetical protein